MAELDFLTFGIDPDNQILARRITEVLSEIYSFGNFHLRSAWLYYGDIPAAANALNLPVTTYLELVHPSKLLSLGEVSLSERGHYRDKIIDKFDHQTCEDYEKALCTFKRDFKPGWEWINSGAQMILEFSDSERKALFSGNYSLGRKEEFIQGIKSWKQKPQKNIIAVSKLLLEYYFIMWNARRDVGWFLNHHIIKSLLQDALECKEDLILAENMSEVCSVTLDIFREYEIYLEQWSETRKQIKKQRNIAGWRREKFFNELVAKDGLSCAMCGVSENLRLDHIKAVVLGGLSVIDNLQLLCFSCNSRKGKTERAILHPTWRYF